MNAKEIWQAQVVESSPMSLDDLRSRLSKMNRLILARTFVAGLACVIFSVFAVMIFRVRTHISVTDLRAAECVFLIGAGYWFIQVISGLRRAPGKLRTEGEATACAAFYRSELKRQRAFHRRSAVLPPLGFSACLVVVFLLVPQFKIMMTVIWVLFVPFYVLFNLELAKRSQRELDKRGASSGQ